MMDGVWVVETGDKVAVTRVEHILPSIKITYSGFGYVDIKCVHDGPVRREYEVKYNEHYDPNEHLSPQRTDLIVWQWYGLYDEPTHF